MKFFLTLLILAISQIAITSSFAASAKSPSFSFSNLATLIEKNPVQSIEDLLPLIPADIRSRYVVVYSSRSLQGATFQKPRIIMFDKDAQFVAAFNGSSKLKGFDDLEVIQFDDNKNTFEFREIHFSKGEKPVISSANPDKCLQCHQSANRKDVDPRPNWEPYSTWPGVFGSNDGGLPEPGFLPDLSNFSDSMRSINHPEVIDILKMSQDETANAKTFADTYLSDLRYKYLGSPNFKFVMDDGDAQMPLYLTNALAKLNFKRVARLLMAQPSYGIFKYFLLNGLDCTSQDQIDYSKFSGPLKKLISKRLAFDLREEPYISELFNMFVDSLDVQTDDWSMDFQTKGLLGFYDRFTTPGGPNQELLAQIALQDKEVNNLVLFTNYGYADSDPTNYRSIEVQAKMKENSCLKTKTLAMDQYKILAAKVTAPKSTLLSESNSSQPAKQGPALLSKCIVCHTGPNHSGPIIDFDQLGLLKNELNAGSYAHGHLIDEIKFRTRRDTTPSLRMPLGQETDPELVNALIQYLENL